MPLYDCGDPECGECIRAFRQKAQKELKSEAGAAHMNDLKSCPFCDGGAETDTMRSYRNVTTGQLAHGVAIYCTGCGVELMHCREDHRGVDDDELLEWCIAAWNRRADPTPPAAKMATAGVYVASRAKPELAEMWRAYRAAGHTITATWIDEVEEGASDFPELWERIRREVAHSIGLVLYVEEGHFPLKGALVEVGMALAAQKPIAVVAPNVYLEMRSFRPIGSWMNHPLVHRAQTVGEALEWLAAWNQRAAPSGDAAMAAEVERMASEHDASAAYMTQAGDDDAAAFHTDRASMFRTLLARCDAADRAGERIKKLEEGLRPLAFLADPGLRVVFTRLPAGLTTLPDGVVCIISGPWPDHLVAPEVGVAIANARALLAPGANGETGS